MDWTTLLRVQQADFIQRMKSGYLLHCEQVGNYSELTLISDDKLKQLRDFCWEMAEKYKQKSSVRDLFINNLKGKLGEEVIKAYLSELITEVDYEKRIGGDGKVDFTLTSNSDIGIQVKTRHATNIDTVRWSITDQEINKNTVVACILIKEEVSEAQSKYSLILVGFLPTSMIQSRNGKAMIEMKDLLFGGGLRSYLEYQAHSQTVQQGHTYSITENQILPSPLNEFPDLVVSLQLLQDAVNLKQKIAICGDYDGHSMTTIALLLRGLRWLGAQVDYAIPSRMHEGFGINNRIVEEFYREGVKLIIIINGIYAYEAVSKARQLGLKVIIIDYHENLQKLPLANTILNSKVLEQFSPYYCLTSIGIAFILVVSLTQQLGCKQGLIKPMLDLFLLGILAEIDDPVPLIGANQLWVKQGIHQILQSRLIGVQALIQVSGLCEIKKALELEDVASYLGFPIDAIGRVGNPQTVIELLTTDDIGIALERAMQCETIKDSCLQMCEEIEQEAIEQIKIRKINIVQDNILTLVKLGWHHGVIGIVASSLVKRYQVPVFIGTYEDDNTIRGSARGTPNFDVFEALIECKDLLGKYGGNKRCGGFSLPCANLELFRSRLCKYAAAFYRS